MRSYCITTYVGLVSLFLIHSQDFKKFSAFFEFYLFCLCLINRYI